MSMNQIGFMPKRTLQPMGYQPLRAGQFRGFGGCNVFPSNNTVINNNIMGGGMMGGCSDYSNSCCDGGGSNKAMNWMLGVGLGASLLGFLGNMFGLGGGGGAEKASDDPVKTEAADTQPVVDENEEKFKQAQRDLDSALKALGEDPTKGSVLKGADGNFKYMFNGQVFDSLDDLTKSIRDAKKPAEPAAAVIAPEKEPPEAEDPPVTPEQPVAGEQKPRANNSPVGWYRAVNDKQELSAEKAELEQYAKDNKNPAEELCNKLLGTKLGNVITDSDKKELLQEIIKKNPSVFSKDGKLLPNADCSKLDVPTKDWMEKKYNVQVIQKNDNDINAVVIKRVKGEASRERRMGKDGKFHQYDTATGKMLKDNYANATKLTDKSGITARVWADGSRISYHDKDGKQITDLKQVQQVPQELRNKAKEVIKLKSAKKADQS